MENYIIGVSQNICRIRELIDQVADTGLNTVIHGETGVGKELVVQCLYQKSNRLGKPFVTIDDAVLNPIIPYLQGFQVFDGVQRLLFPILPGLLINVFEHVLRGIRFLIEFNQHMYEDMLQADWNGWRFLGTMLGGVAVTDEMQAAINELEISVLVSDGSVAVVGTDGQDYAYGAEADDVIDTGGGNCPTIGDLVRR